MDDNNNITELRNILFDTIRGLKNKTIDTEQAKAINDTAQTIINSAKVEVHYSRITGRTTQTHFLDDNTPPPARKSTTNQVQDKPAGGYVHKIGQRHN